MFDFILDQSQLILTGIIITYISSFIYTIKPTGFKSRGKYRTKQGAIAIYLVASIILGFFTPFIHLLSGLIIEVVPIISIFGFFMFSTNYMLNERILTWKHTTPKTLLIYASSMLIMIIGFLWRF